MGRRILLIAGCIICGILLAAAGLWTVSMTDQRGLDTVGRLGGILLSGVVVFTLAVQTPHRRRRARPFWVTLGLLVCVHGAFFFWLMSQIPNWRALWWGAVIPLEWLAVSRVLRRVSESREEYAKSHQ